MPFKLKNLKIIAEKKHELISFRKVSNLINISQNILPLIIWAFRKAAAGLKVLNNDLFPIRKDLTLSFADIMEGCPVPRSI